ncbi:hypothetical protein EJB05_11747 [Eragrostis curvula]|uniref:Protein kinase domain-containing protein n=1 Tax=Eragrostis curvula TaxID=38414 RepID=A0A5J9VTG4_9POAL|nr:hypothetical protein EJB05_11747 [Eragrostis curvula]
MAARFLFLYATLLPLATAAPSDLTQADVAKRLKDELWERNPGHQMLKSWNGDPCSPSSWEGFTCGSKDGSLVILKLNFSSKNLQGPIPAAIGNLTELNELDLQDNNFTGSIPASFSALKHLLKLSVYCNPFLSNKKPDGLSTGVDFSYGGCAAEENLSPPGAASQRIIVIGGIAGGSLAYPIFQDCSIHKTTNPEVQQLSLKSIQNATGNFKTLIGEGGFGAVYRGTLAHGQEVAVKVRSSTSTQGTREFNNELRLLSTVRHENLVPLIGYCCEKDQQILVYPFMSNGSLQDRLYGEASKRKVLDWPTRLSICIGAARGLVHLHNFAGRCIIHRDVKSSNILMDHSMCGKVADFGFSKYAPQEGDSNASMEVRGTAGYLDPEYYSTQVLSTRSDVFSFGVVLLEIVTGREPLDVQRPRDAWSLVEWAKPYIREYKIEEIVDPGIKGQYCSEAMWRVLEVASVCTEPFSTFRPSMEDVLRELEDALIIENNASEYMRSIESTGTLGSNRYLSMDRRMFASGSARIDATTGNLQTMPSLPR